MIFEQRCAAVRVCLRQRREAAGRLFDSTLGRSREFLRSVLIPQAFGFVLLLVAGAILLQGIDSLTTRLAALAFLLIIGLLVSSSREYVSHRFVVGYVLALSSVLTVAALLLRLELTTHVFLPLAGLLLPFLGLRLPRVVGGTLVGGGLTLGVLSLLCAVDGWGSRSGSLGGLSVLLLVGGLVLVRCERDRASSSRPVQVGAGEARQNRSGETADEAPEAGEDLLQRDLQVLWNRTARGEFLGEALWRLTVLSLVSGASVVGLIFQLEPVQRLLAASWIALAVIYGGVLIQFVRARDFERVVTAAFLNALVVVVWWVVLAAESRIEGPLPEFLFVFVALSLGSLPWPRRFGVALGGLLLGVSSVRFLSGAEPLLWGGALMALIPIYVRLLSMSAINAQTRVALHFLRRFGESAPTSLSACRALAWQLGCVVEAERVLLLIGERRHEVIERGSARGSKVDSVFARGLHHTIVSFNRDDGSLFFRDLSPQYLAPCLDWFGLVPTEFFFQRCSAVIEGREETLVVVMPCTFTARVCGRGRVMRALGGLAAIVRSWLGAARGRLVSSDVIMATQQSISAREEDLNHLVHLVNNTAQDIAAECDDVRQLAAAGEVEVEPAIAARLDGIERLARSLSAGASDVKLLKELLRVRVLTSRDTVDVASLLEDVAMFGRFRAGRAGKSFRVEVGEATDLRLTVASREFLSMVLRMLVRLAEGRSPRGGEIVLEAGAEGEMIRLVVRDTGGPIDGPRIEYQLAHLEEEESGDRALEVYRAATNLTRLSRGGVSFGAGEDLSAVALHFPRAAAVPMHARVYGWILLVDDNVQVTGFYARVAEALEHRYHTAASLGEAQAIIAREGRPRLVVSDLQLGDGSGLDLVRDLRQRFGGDLPIVVVSGNTGAELVDEVRAAGVTSYLAKPVGRSKLLAEMRSLLRG
jgi:CheY-like chemotaxis protein